MRKPLIVANWKMNHGITQTADFIRSTQATQLPTEREVVICPPFTSLFVFKNGGLNYGAQDMHWEEKGAFTGEVSPAMLKELGCSYVIIGHSERRQYFAETTETVQKKVAAALAHQLTPIICVSELDQVQGLEITPTMVVAYEPLWAIGTGKTATPEQAQAMHADIRKLVGEDVRIIYGGSVNDQTATALMAQPDVDGLLVGGASLDIKTFLGIINY